MTNRSNNNQRGFTIIEVALVLAVAALIFLVVFLAVPALQRNQRDDARKRDVSMVVEAVVNYGANANSTNLVNGGSGAPEAGAVWEATSSLGKKLTTYIDKLSGNVDYVHVVGIATIPTVFNTAQTIANGNYASSTATPGLNNIAIYQRAKCDGNVGLVKGSNRQNAVVIQVENGGDGKYYCQDAN